LEFSYHLLPSIIDHQTITKSGDLPASFLRGCGLPDSLIEFLPSLLAPVQFHSCFISYSTTDQTFAETLHTDLSKAGIRSWFAPAAMGIGDPIARTINDAIVTSDKMLLILSKSSIDSEWVEKEVAVALERERALHRPVLFPIRLDDAVMSASSELLAQVREKHIGDFTDWKNQDAYRKAFSRLIRDLTFSFSPESYG
jgi:hypothetical protein